LIAGPVQVAHARGLICATTSPPSKRVPQREALPRAPKASTLDDDGRGGLSRPAPDEPPLKEHTGGLCRGLGEASVAGSPAFQTGERQTWFATTGRRSWSSSVARPGFPARCARRGRSRSQSSRADAVAPVLVLMLVPGDRERQRPRQAGRCPEPTRGGPTRIATLPLLTASPDRAIGVLSGLHVNRVRRRFRGRPSTRNLSRPRTTPALVDLRELVPDRFERF
jgi:hypothetical protein